MKALSLTTQKLWPMLKFWKSRSKVKVMRSKFWYQWKGLVTRNTHVKYESPLTYHSKVMANVKVFADKQSNRLTDKQTDRPKTICPRICDSGGIKMIYNMSILESFEITA